MHRYFKSSNYIFPLTIFLLSLIFFSQIIQNPDLIFLPSQDIVSIFFQEKSLFVEALKNYKTLPLWNSYVFSGSPLLANPTSSMLYPPNLIFLIFPPKYSFAYMFFIDSFLLGLFTYLLARSINISRFGSFISGTTIMFSGPILIQIFPGHIANLDTFIWLPLILLFYEHAIRKQKLIYGALASIPIAFSFLAGASQIAVFSTLSASIYYLCRLISNLPQDNKLKYMSKTIGIFFFSVIVGLLLSSAQLIPSSEFSKLSARAGGLSYEFASDFSLHPKQLISFILPYFFGNPKNGTYWGTGNFWELNGYLGILPIILSLYAIKSRENRYKFIFTALGILALLFSLGKYSFVFAFFYNYVPLFSSFRVPARFLYTYAFSVSILTGLGIDILIKKLASDNKVFNRTLTIILTVGLVAFAAALFLPYDSKIFLYERFILNNKYALGINHKELFRQFTEDLFSNLLIILSFCFILLLKIKNKINLGIFKFLLAAIIISELWIFNYKVLPSSKTFDSNDSTEIVREIKKDKGIFRIFDKEGLYLPSTKNEKIENITGIHSLYLKDYRDFVWVIGKHIDKPYESFFEIKNIEYPIFLDLLNVKYVIEDKKLSLNQNFLPRAYIVPNAIILSKNKILNTLKNKSFDPKNQVILQKNPNVTLNNRSIFAEVGVYHREPNKILLKTILKEPGFLILSEIYYPGWKAYDNGKELEIYKADYILRSIFLTKGSHDIAFIFSPDSYKTGVFISLLTFFLLMVYLLNKIRSLAHIKSQ